MLELIRHAYIKTVKGFGRFLMVSSEMNILKFT